MRRINILEKAGSFAENKDIARDIRHGELFPALAQNQEVILDFDGVDATTQSFIHALISDAIRQYGDKALENITYHKCNDTIKQLVKIVVDYMQEGIGENSPKGGVAS